MDGVLHHLRRLVLPRDDATDGELLERFLATRDEAAFATIVRRHGPMVLGVCRRVLARVQDAEDAFQASFLVLVHKAASVAKREALGSWLYGVAYRTACKARAAAVRRRAKEVQMARPEAQQEADDLWRELRPLLDQELSRLPEKYRAPIVLCDLQGQTRKQAAQQLGCPEGTVSGRLARARTMLAQRLARRGLALSSTAIAVALTHSAASAGVGIALVECTTKAATVVAAGHVAAGVISAPVAALTEGVLKSMGISKLKLVLAMLLAVGLLGVGWGVCLSGAQDNAKGGGFPGAQVSGGGSSGGGTGSGSGALPARQKIDLPTGPAPIQVLARIEGDSRLVLKWNRSAGGEPPAGPSLDAAPPGIGGGTGGVGGPAAPAVPGGPPGGGGGLGGAAGPAARPARIEMAAYDPDSVTVIDTKGTKLDRKEWMGRLKQDTVALASWSGPVDPRHLRVIKDGTLIFVIPSRRLPGGPGIVPPRDPGAGASR